MKTFWKRSITNKIFVILTIAILCSLLISIIGDYARIQYFSWVGVSDYGKPTGIDERGKTLWDWFQLLIIPVVLVGGAFLLNRSERIAQNRTEEQRRKDAQELEDRRAKLAQEIATDQGYETTLQTYLDRMTELLLDRKLRESPISDPVRDVGRARTLTVLRRLDGERKGLLLKFLYESDLVRSPFVYTLEDSQRGNIKERRQEPVISFKDADLGGIRLANISLNEVDLSGADLTGADIQNSYFYTAILTGASFENATLLANYFVQANLSRSNLNGADLSASIMESAVLADAKLFGTILDKSNMRNANLEQADLFDSKLRSVDLYGANLSRANLRKIDLFKSNASEVDFSETTISEANFQETKMMNTNLEGCILYEVDFRNADLEGANLKEVDLRKCQVEGTKFTKARYNRNTLWPEDLDLEKLNVVLEE